MPPQPLSRVKPNASSRFTRKTLATRPDFAALVMKVISIWSMIDGLLAQTVAQFLKADFEIVTAMFESLSGAEARRAAFLGAAQEALNKDDFRLLQAVLKVIKPSRDRRNMFVHDIFGYAPELPDAVLLAPAHVVTQHLTDIEITIRDLEPGQTYEPPRPIINHSKAFVFQKKDIEEEVGHANSALGLVIDLRFLFSSLDSMHDATRTELLNQPLVRQFYEKLSG